MKKIHGLNSFEKGEKITPEETQRNLTKLPGHSEIGLHMVFDTKMDGLFTWKTRLVVNGNETPELPNMNGMQAWYQGYRSESVSCTQH
mmetsp:Transcript_35753/g.50665  ORF Transcript_35753/g.50665 Transcript_35753/m.50665 type:complete len:88 (+) Transcript_35753:337-600(+)